jgi:hypothetical protein
MRPRNKSAPVRLSRIKQPGIGGDLAAHESQLQTAIEIDPQLTVLAVTHRISLSIWHEYTRFPYFSGFWGFAQELASAQKLDCQNESAQKLGYNAGRSGGLTMMTDKPDEKRWKWRWTAIVSLMAVLALGIFYFWPQIGGGGLWLWGRHSSDGGDISQRDIVAVEFSDWPGGGLGDDAWTLTVYGDGHGTLKENWPRERSVVFSMPTRIRDLLGALVRCDVRRLPFHLGAMYSEGQAVRCIKIRTRTFEKLISIHDELDESEEKTRCVMGVWKSALKISEAAQKIPETQKPGKSR